MRFPMCCRWRGPIEFRVDPSDQGVIELCLRRVPVCQVQKCGPVIVAQPATALTPPTSTVEVLRGKAFVFTLPSSLPPFPLSPPPTAFSSTTRPPLSVSTTLRLTTS